MTASESQPTPAPDAKSGSEKTCDSTDVDSDQGSYAKSIWTFVLRVLAIRTCLGTAGKHIVSQAEGNIDTFLKMIDELKTEETDEKYILRTEGVDHHKLEKASSALTHSDAAGSLSSLARMEAADAFQTKGFGSALCSAR